MRRTTKAALTLAATVSTVAAMAAATAAATAGLSLPATFTGSGATISGTLRGSPFLPEQLLLRRVT